MRVVHHPGVVAHIRIVIHSNTRGLSSKEATCPLQQCRSLLATIDSIEADGRCVDLELRVLALRSRARVRKVRFPFVGAPRMRAVGVLCLFDETVQRSRLVQVGSSQGLDPLVRSFQGRCRFSCCMAMAAASR